MIADWAADWSTMALPVAKDAIRAEMARLFVNALSPRVRAMIINYDPSQAHALPVTEFCRSLKVSRSVFYKIRDRAASQSTAALHPRSRVPKHPARHVGDVVNELVKIVKWR